MVLLENPRSFDFISAVIDVSIEFILSLTELADDLIFSESTLIPSLLFGSASVSVLINSDSDSTFPSCPSYLLLMTSAKLFRVESFLFSKSSGAGIDGKIAVTLSILAGFESIKISSTNATCFLI